MFGIFKNWKKSASASEAKKSGLNKNKLAEKINHAIDVFNNKINDTIDELLVIREKMKDLSKTNYDLGLKHLEKGNLKEAVFRFKLVKKFWPHNYEAYYQLAYSLVLLEKYVEARAVIDQLLKKDRSYEPRVLDLLNSIDRSKGDGPNIIIKKN
jgi:tetratricopeptide (TPR) repeat protein